MSSTAARSVQGEKDGERKPNGDTTEKKALDRAISETSKVLCILDAKVMFEPWFSLIGLIFLKTENYFTGNTARWSKWCQKGRLWWVAEAEMARGCKYPSFEFRVTYHLTPPPLSIIGEERLAGLAGQDLSPDQQSAHSSAHPDSWCHF